MLYHIALFFHIVSIMLVAGGGIGAIVVENQLWKKIAAQSPDAKGLMSFFKAKTKLIKIGIVLFILSGTLLLYSVQWIYLSQGWFIAKLLLFISLPLRGALIEDKILSNIATVINTKSNSTYDLPVLFALRTRLNRFHIIQLSFVAAIVFLVIFKV